MSSGGYRFYGTLILIVCVGAACRPPHEIERLPEWMEARQRMPLYEARGYRMEWIDTAGQRLYLTARQVLRVKQGDTLIWYFRGGVLAYHLNMRGETLETLRSQEAQVYPERRSFIARQEVFLTTAEGWHLETDYLLWEQDRNRITAPGWVRFQTPKEILRGEGLEYNISERTYRLRRTRGTVQSPL